MPDSQSTALDSQRWITGMNGSIFRIVGGVGHSSVHPRHEKSNSSSSSFELNVVDALVRLSGLNALKNSSLKIDSQRLTRLYDWTSALVSVCFPWNGPSLFNVRME